MTEKGRLDYPCTTILDSKLLVNALVGTVSTGSFEVTVFAEVIFAVRTVVDDVVE